MSNTINNNRPSTAATATTATTQATNDPAPSEKLKLVDPPAPSAAGRAGVPKAKIDGMSRLTGAIDNSNSANDVMTGDYEPSISKEDIGKSTWATGFIKVETQPTADGVRIKIDSFHRTKDEKLKLLLQTQVFDEKTGDLQTVTLSVLANDEVLNPGKNTGTRTYDVSYEDINDYLGEFSKDLKIKPEQTRLFVTALWTVDKHRAGGPGRGGFTAPQPTGKQSVVSTQIGQITGKPGKVKASDMPLDMSVGFSQKLLNHYDYSNGYLRFSDVLEAKGAITTRLESEFKGSSSEAAMEQALAKAYELAELSKQAKDGDKAARSKLDKLLGKDRILFPVERHYLRDEKGEVKRDLKTGLPEVDPMIDEYSDDAELHMTQLSGAIRVRSNAQKAGHLEIKAGGGVLDPKTGIRQRVETGYDLKAGVKLEQIKQFLASLNGTGSSFKNSIFNHGAKEVHELDASIKLEDCFEPFLKVEQIRHKFTLKNQATGVEQELSLDKVVVTTLRDEHKDKDGQPRTITFYVVEGELNHLQLTSANTQKLAQASGTPGAFLSNADQVKWLEDKKNDTAKLALAGEPRLHTLQDLENPEFRDTDSYREFEDMNGRLLPTLFPAGLGPARQKAAHAAEALGLVGPEKTRTV